MSGNWSPESWRNRPIVQVPEYPDTDALNAAETLAELAPSKSAEIHIDAAIRGLGTAACGPDTLPEYCVGAGTYQFRWQLSATKRS